jgi:hypothetical protein
MGYWPIPERQPNPPFTLVIDFIRSEHFAHGAKQSHWVSGQVSEQTESWHRPVWAILQNEPHGNMGVIAFDQS